MTIREVGTEGHGQADSDPSTVGVCAPTNLEVHHFKVGAEEYVALSFPLAAEEQPERLPRVPLTESEHEICVLVLAGLSNAEIGRRRGTSPRTIANQIAGLYRKLGIGSRRELQALASRFGDGT